MSRVIIVHRLNTIENADAVFFSNESTMGIAQDVVSALVLFRSPVWVSWVYSCSFTDAQTNLGWGMGDVC